MTSVAPQAVRFAGRDFPKKRHVCAFFYSKEEEYQALLPYVKEGIQSGQKAFHIVDPNRRQAHLAVLRNTGIDVDGAQKTGQLEVKVWEEAYLREGRFSQDSMLRLIEDVLQGKSSEKRFPLIRLVANMEWALKDLPGVDDLVEYETRLNYILPKYDDPVI